MPVLDRFRSAGKSKRAALVLWMAGFAAALAGELVLRSGGSLLLGRCLLIAAIPLGGLAVAGTKKWGADEPPSHQDLGDSPTSRWTGPAILLVVIGIIVVATSAFLVWRGTAHSLALIVWVLGLVAVLAGLRLVDTSHPAHDRKPSSAQVWALCLVIVAALLLRIPDLVSVPPDVHGDEAEIGLQARAILGGGPIFQFGWFDVPGLSFAIPAPLVRLFSNDLYGLRATSVLESLGAILLLYLLIKRMFGTRVALLSAFFMAVAQWNIHFSRTGSHYMQAQLAILLALYLLVLALDTKKVVYFGATGLAIGLCLNVYYAGRLIVFLVPAILVQRALSDRAFLKTHFRRVALIPFGLVLFLAPMIPAIINRPDAVMSRTSGVSVFTPENLEHERLVHGEVDLLDVLVINTRSTLEAFHLSGETSFQYGERGPLLDPWMGALLPLALVYLFGVRDWRRVLLGVWVGLSLASIIVTIDAPFGPRMIVLIPPVMVLCALALDTFLRALEHLKAPRYALFVGTATVLLLAAQSNYQDYFGSFVTREQPADFHTVLARFIERSGPDHRYILFGSPVHSINYVTVSFLVPEADRVDAGTEILEKRVPNLPPGKGLVFFVDTSVPNAGDQITRLRKLYPSAEEKTISTSTGNLLFVSFSVPPDEA